MNIRKNTLKIIATGLAIINLANTFTVRAVKDPLTGVLPSTAGGGGVKIINKVCKDSAKLKSNLDQQVDKFLKLGEGHFEISDGTIEKVHPLILFVYLKVLNDFFEKYPNIKSKFLQLSGKKFSIGCLVDVETDDDTETALMYVHRVNHSRLQIDENFHRKTITDIYHTISKNLALRHTAPITISVYNIFAYSVAHELGHLFELLIITAGFAKSRPEALETIESYDRASRLLNILEKINGGADMEPRIQALREEKRKHEHAPRYFRETITKMSDILKAQLSGQAKSSFISKYGEENSLDWFAEGFAHALLSEKPNAIGQAILKLLDQKEKEFATEFAK